MGGCKRLAVFILVIIGAWLGAGAALAGGPRGSRLSPMFLTTSTLNTRQTGTTGRLGFGADFLEAVAQRSGLAPLGFCRFLRQTGDRP